MLGVKSQKALFWDKQKNRLFQVNLFLSCQKTRLTGKMHWALLKIFTPNIRSTNCSHCHKQIRYILEKEDILVRGKSLVCPYCQSVLWVSLNGLRKTSNQPFFRLDLAQNEELGADHLNQ